MGWAWSQRTADRTAFVPPIATRPSIPITATTAHASIHRRVDVDGWFLGGGRGLGISEMNAYRAKPLRFGRYCDEFDADAA